MAQSLTGAAPQAWRLVPAFAAVAIVLFASVACAAGETLVAAPPGSSLAFIGPVTEALTIDPNSLTLGPASSFVLDLLPNPTGTTTETVLATDAVDLVLDQATGDLTAILLASGDNCTVASAFVSDGVWFHLRLAITPAWLNLTVAPDSGSAPLGCQAPVSSPAAATYNLTDIALGGSGNGFRGLVDEFQVSNTTSPARYQCPGAGASADANQTRLLYTFDNGGSAVATTPDACGHGGAGFFESGRDVVFSHANADRQTPVEVVTAENDPLAITLSGYDVDNGTAATTASVVASPGAGGVLYNTADGITASLNAPLNASFPNVTHPSSMVVYHPPPGAWGAGLESFSYVVFGPGGVGAPSHEAAVSVSVTDNLAPSIGLPAAVAAPVWRPSQPVLGPDDLASVSVADDGSVFAQVNCTVTGGPSGTGLRLCTWPPAANASRINATLTWPSMVTGSVMDLLATICLDVPASGSAVNTTAVLSVEVSDGEYVVADSTVFEVGSVASAEASLDRLGPSQATVWAGNNVSLSVDVLDYFGRLRAGGGPGDFNDTVVVDLWCEGCGLTPAVTILVGLGNGTYAGTTGVLTVAASYNASLAINGGMATDRLPLGLSVAALAPAAFALTFADGQAPNATIGEEVALSIAATDIYGNPSAVDPADFEVVVAEAASGALLSPAVYRFEVSADGLPPGFLSAVGFVLEAGSLSLVLRRVSDPHRQALASATVTVTVSCSRGRYPAPASACEPCPADTFSLDFSSVCTPCPDGGSAPAGSGSCACNLGFYRVVNDEGVLSCRACPDGAVCSGTVPVAAPGFWSAGEGSDGNVSFTRCVVRAHCEGGVDSACVVGHTGFLCETCTDGFRKISWDCAACPPFSLSTSILTMAAAMLVGVGVCAAVVHAPSIHGTVGVLVTYLQMVALLLYLPVAWPPSILALMRSASLVYVNIDMFGFACTTALPYTFHWMLGLSSFLGVAVLFLILLAGRVVYYFAVGRKKAADAAVARAQAEVMTVERYVPNTPRRAADFTLSAFVYMMMVLHPQITATALTLLGCRSGEDANSEVLRMRPDVDCDIELRGTLVFVAVGAVVVIGVGAPLAMSGFLYSERRRLTTDETLKNRYGSLFLRFHPRWYLWEAVCVGAKAAIPVAAALPIAVLFQIVVVIVVSFAFLLGHLFFRPYREPLNNRLSSLSIAGVIFLLFCGLIFTFEDDKVAKTDSVIFEVLAVAALAVLVLVLAGVSVWQVYRYAHRMATFNVADGFNQEVAHRDVLRVVMLTQAYRLLDELRDDDRQTVTKACETLSALRNRRVRRSAFLSGSPSGGGPN